MVCSECGVEMEHREGCEVCPHCGANRCEGLPIQDSTPMTEMKMEKVPEAFVSDVRELLDARGCPEDCQKCKAAYDKVRAHLPLTEQQCDDTCKQFTRAKKGGA